jgi:hypothetical protein
VALDLSVPGRPVGGRRDPGPAPKGILKLTDFVDVRAVVTHSPSCDWTAGVDFGLYTNDRFGVCGPTYVANHRRLVTKWCTGTEQRPTQDDVYDLYRRSGNPDFDPATGADDNGVDMRVMLDAVVKGGIGGVKAVAYAAIDPHDLDQIQAAVEIFHGVGHGVTLHDAQKTQATWDYVPGSPVWGGHAILGAAFVPGDDEVISWAQRFAATKAFIAHQDDEAFIVIWPEHLTDPRVDVPKLQSAFKALTGHDLVLPTPPPGPVAPFPGALVEAVAAAAADPAVAAFLSRPHSGVVAHAASRLRAILAAPRS